jgi:hypothetical protein
MSLSKKIAAGAIALAVGLMVGCGGGGGGNTSTGGTYLSHAQVAAEFVRRMNIDLVGYDVELVKTNTLQYDYIVVYDWDFGSYDAYYIGAYNPGENLYSYLNLYNYKFYYDLIPESGNVYYDPYTGLRFQKGAGSSKDQAKLKAFKQSIAVKLAADSLQVQYGMSAEKAVSAARFAYNLKTQPEGTYNVRDYDAFAKDLVGTSITEFQKDIKSGNAAGLAEKIDKAAEITGMGPEGVNRLMQEMFIGGN